MIEQSKEGRRRARRIGIRIRIRIRGRGRKEKIESTLTSDVAFLLNFILGSLTLILACKCSTLVQHQLLSSGLPKLKQRGQNFRSPG